MPLDAAKQTRPVARRSGEADRLVTSCQQWSGFQNALLRQDRSSQGNAFERLTQLYLKTQPEYLSKLKHVWRWREVPLEIRTKLKLPRPDEGIDLLAETHEGNLWAVQCKFRSKTDPALTRRQLSTFVALASVAGISKLVVAHTSSRPIRKRSLMGDMVEIGLEHWLALDETAWSVITSAAQGRATPPEPRRPLPHQQRALAEATKHYAERGASRGRLIMPCGTGKTLTAFFIAEALNAGTILIAVPSLSLIRQSLTDWTREYLARGERPDWLCVCSDDSVGDLEKDRFVAETYDLGIPTTTGRQEVGDFLAKPNTDRRIVLTTYQSSHVLAAAARDVGAQFDFAVLDEAHRTVGPPSRTFGTLLRDSAINIRRRLFMTATERVLRGEDDTVLSMDDEVAYGARFFLLTFKEAIAEKIISDYRILTITISDDHVRELVQENRLLQVTQNDEAEARTIAAGFALKRAFHERGVKHAISFHRSIRAAERFRTQQDALGELTKIGPVITNFHISSKKTAGQRVELLQRFAQSQVALMTNARCLTEGVDIPAVDCVLFADPKQSVVDIVQAAGRALRRSPGKECGYIVLPLLVPSGLDLHTFAEFTSFRQVARTITALSTQDERIAEEFRLLTKGQKPSDPIIEIEGDIPVGLPLDLNAFADSILTRIWERVGRANWISYEEALPFARSLGLKSATEWQRFVSSHEFPPDMPKSVRQAYSGRGWTSWGDWLGTGTVAYKDRRYCSFEEARAFARGLGLKSKADWDAYCKSGKNPADIPAYPERIYAGQGWSGYGDWLLGHARYRQVDQSSFENVRSSARSLNIKSWAEWRRYAKAGLLPKVIPHSPEAKYRYKGWQGWGDWLGTGRRWGEGGGRRYKKAWLSFEEARAFARGLGLKSKADWYAYCKSGKKPADIPMAPNYHYRDKGWQGWRDWLGTGPSRSLG